MTESLVHLAAALISLYSSFTVTNILALNSREQNFDTVLN
jgi:hypothetical protein